MSEHAELAVDWTLCKGHGLCAALLPGRIALDEWGYPVLAAGPIPAGELRETRRAVAACPALALRLGQHAPSTPALAR